MTRDEGNNAHARHPGTPPGGWAIFHPGGRTPRRFEGRGATAFYFHPRLGALTT